ncbi:MAG: DUF1961 family protein [Planctomycetota bacterium]
MEQKKLKCDCPAFAEIKITEDGPVAKSIKWTSQPDRASFRIINGPKSDTLALKAENQQLAFKGSFTRPLAGKGSVMLWFKINQTLCGGRGVGKTVEKILEVKDLFRVTLINKGNSVNLVWEWAQDMQDVDDMRVAIPAIPGSVWIHLAVHWDNQAGLFNGYFNGTPLRIPGTSIPAWQTQGGTELTIHVGRFTIGELTFLDYAFGPQSLPQIVEKQHLGTLDDFLGLKDLGTLCTASCRGGLIYENSLSSRQDIANWVLEGPGKITFEDGRMVMESLEPAGPAATGHIVHWCDRDFPESFIAEWDFQLVDDYGLCIVFFSANGINGESIFDPNLEKRNGYFGHYIFGDINCYHISYCACTPFDPGRSMSNLRKNPGFYLVANGPIGIRPACKDAHKVTLMKVGPHIQMAVDAKKIIDFEDDGERNGPVWGAGKIGLRQMKWTRASYRNFKVYAVK